MISNKHHSSILQGSITDQESETRPNIKDFRAAREEWDIKQLLSMLPRKKASADFDRKMAAAFSLELQREVTQKNAAFINEKS